MLHFCVIKCFKDVQDEVCYENLNVSISYFCLNLLLHMKWIDLRLTLIVLYWEVRLVGFELLCTGIYVYISISGVRSFLICTFTRINVHKSIRRCDHRHIQCIRFHILILYMYYFNYMYLCIYTKEVKHFYWFF